MAQYNFGAGSMFCIPQGANPTPVRIGGLQESSVDFSAGNKIAVGQYKYGLAVGQGQIKVTGKSKFLQVNAAAYNNLFFNNTVASGQTLAAIDEAQSVPASTPYTVNVANKTTFTKDLGVRYALTGLPLTCVASAPTVGQYTVANGVYTFAAADTGVALYFCYLYTVTSGYNIVLNNQLMGQAPAFMAIFNGIFGGNQTTLILNSVTGSKLTPWDTKLEDFVIPEFDFDAVVDASNTLGILSTAQ